jgi:serpin B
LTLANATWGQTGYAFLPTYLDLLAANYGAGIRLVDFAGAAEIARATINGWVSDNTQHRQEAQRPLDPRDQLQGQSSASKSLPTRSRL